MEGTWSPEKVHQMDEERLKDKEESLEWLKDITTKLGYDEVSSPEALRLTEDEMQKIGYTKSGFDQDQAHREGLSPSDFHSYISKNKAAKAIIKTHGADPRMFVADIFSGKEHYMNHDFSKNELQSILEKAGK
ncbi:MAG: hypothetical protein Q8P11_03890 [bacterium]|nr:hypothetical protein [bacterium]